MTNLTSLQEEAEAYVEVTGCQLAHLEREVNAWKFAEALDLRKFPKEDFIEAVGKVSWGLSGDNPDNPDADIWKHVKDEVKDEVVSSENETPMDTPSPSGSGREAVPRGSTAPPPWASLPAAKRSSGHSKPTLVKCSIH